MLGEKLAVLVAADGAAWEVEALRALGAPGSGCVLLKRCVDLPDLLASATTGQARVAVVAGELSGIDADSVAHLRRCGVGVVAVGGPTVAPPGVHSVVPASSVEALPAEVAAAASAGEEPGAGTAVDVAPVGHGPVDEPGADTDPAPGRVVAVWGPTGAPGRTTVAVGVAAELAALGVDTLLLDADGYGGAVGQHLGVLDEVSGLLSAVRQANAGRLDTRGLAALARTVPPGVRVLTGLPRADRWVEVRAQAFDAVLHHARRLGETSVLDVGFSLEEDAPHGGPERNLMTLAGLAQADDVVVVGSADPVGLSRLARGLVELRDRVPLAAVHVVVNRMRPSVGWGEPEVRAMVEQFLRPASVHFVPDDRATADRALVSGRPLTELGDSPLRRGLREVVDVLHPEPSAAAPARGRRVRRRRAGRAR